jgi:H+/Cl- antiporter ClcA
MTRQDLYEAGKSVLSFAHWRNRLIFWCGAIIIGIMAAGFAYVADFAQKTFSSLTSLSPYIPLLICPVILGLTGWLTFTYAPSASGSGIPQAIAAHASQDPEERYYLLGPKNILSKIIFTTLGLFGGASVGREGPTVQIGAAILYLGARYTNMSAEMSRSVILAGAAAGVAAAFNTPLAGIVFAIEEMARAFEHRYSGVVLTAIVLAGASSLSLLGNYSYFGYADGNYILNRDWLAIIFLGIVGGFLGGLFSLLLSKASLQMNLINAKSHFLSPAFSAALCGLTIAILGIMTNGETYGSGYAQAKAFLQDGAAGSWAYTIAKLVATIASGLTGIPGGIFSPSLSVGAGLGASVAPWFASTHVAGVVLLGMTAYFAGVTQAPITAFIIVLEISGRQSMPFPLIAASIIASALSRIICPTSLYHALAKGFIEAGSQHRNIADEAVKNI